jgi:hypothetical protein
MSLFLLSATNKITGNIYIVIEEVKFLTSEMNLYTSLQDHKGSDASVAPLILPRSRYAIADCKKLENGFLRWNQMA